ncbi:uncharacterized protein LOC109726713 [Ananas comosus]|uniref:Uncharacterized protein LOC109726713 n=1 Tax=Ananas comosus TaxID=4615 RepID=A0A6P5H1Y5_ANACO|nr:uncharacterized protein LOC109726713 [Ananas comosus]
MGGIVDPQGFHPWLWWELASLLVLRPLLAVAFVVSFVLLSWIVAWKTVLVHVPLVQEICGLRKKPVKPKPANRHRFSNFYKSRSDHRSAKPEVKDKS